LATRSALAGSSGAVARAPSGRVQPTAAGLPSVERLQDGDERALEQLVTELWWPLVRYAERITGSADAEDAVQSAFVRLWRRRAELATGGSLRSLLYTMTRNAAIDACRRERRLAARAAAAGGLALDSAPPTPLAHAQEAELARLAEAAVSRLAPRRQAVFRLVREHGLSYDETAEVLGLSVQTVANHMSLALADLRRALGPTLVEPAAGGRVTDGSSRPPSWEPE